jgi:hypothetical protein
MANLFDLEPRVSGKERRRRGLFLLPSLLTVGNLFCGYACIVYSMSGQLEQAAPVYRHRHRARHARTGASPG